ncbi:MAG: hypothetical protein A3F83_15045 [Candidatus Glassbacteria bacterium RIFCSPLOWO2_12_FULL_58_11]|uniref:NADPH-dependent FMN reductase-like domain-containing protein n=1 Tax=Candidatus Glassbacteria bacterium RIFCSPLOWO2_12_FULL_58_11 TaxID=1817867 RepID=A0A1F5YPG0_9BACT|nr:MAG: hypothetical protein A3F83_15045 [Candidatus Glassbacteria bacterium RIFCSPLOWO2_12_FULL_58_11]
MKIVVLNGSPDSRRFELDCYLAELEGLLETRGHVVKSFELRAMNIGHCTGCWGCWVKTPGECVIRDDSQKVCRAAINSDLLLFASPVIMGFTSAVLKKISDRLIPLLHPYFEIDRGEIHHRKRYERYPAVGLLLERATDTDEEDLELIRDIYARMALDFKSELKFTGLTGNPAEEAADALDRL